MLLGALLADSPHTRPVPVAAGVSDPLLGRRAARGAGRVQGPTGIVGVLQHACTEAGIAAVSLWASVPHYVAQPPSPKATLALLRGVEDILDASLPLADLPLEARAWERGVDELAEQDTEVAEYVRTLEEAKDATDLPEASGDAIAREIERYLRRAVTASPAPLTHFYGHGGGRGPSRGHDPGGPGRRTSRARSAARGRRASPPAEKGAPAAAAASPPPLGGGHLTGAEPAGQLGRQLAAQRRLEPGQRVDGPGGQLAATPLPQHGPELVFLAEADSVVAAEQPAVADRQQVAYLRSALFTTASKTAMSRRPRDQSCGTARPGRPRRRRRSTAGTCPARTARPPVHGGRDQMPARGLRHRVRGHFPAGQGAQPGSPTAAVPPRPACIRRRPRCRPAAVSSRRWRSTRPPAPFHLDLAFAEQLAARLTSSSAGPGAAGPADAGRAGAPARDRGDRDARRETAACQPLLPGGRSAAGRCAPQCPAAARTAGRAAGPGR